MASEDRSSRIRTGGSQPAGNSSYAQDSQDGLVDEIQEVMRLLGEPRLPGGAIANDRVATSRGSTLNRCASDLDSALEMVRRAAMAMDMVEDRSRLIQTRADALAEQASRDLVAANEKADAMQRRALGSEARADALEARLQEAEERLRIADEWLARFHDAITDAFSARRPAAPEPRREASRYAA